MEAPHEWIKIAKDIAAISFNEKHIAPIEVKGCNICLVKTAQGVVACTDHCPHAGGSLSEGYIDQHDNIVCCVHHYKFNLRTGRDALNEGYFLKRYPVLINEEGVFISV